MGDSVKENLKRIIFIIMIIIILIIVTFLGYVAYQVVGNQGMFLKVL